MTVARGRPVYSTGAPPCTGLGLTWSSEELNAALEGPVSAVLFDDEGRTDIEEMMREVVETEFEQEALLSVLARPGRIEGWRVGEAIAETWLTDHHNCYFPWPDGRDERKSGSSLPGADLVGLHADAHGDRLAFGEVKTSSNAKQPPRLMYGRTGLKKQLENLRNSISIRDDLFKYLGHRAKGACWEKRFQQAGKRYLNNTSDVQLFGFLVRDVSPHENDVRVRVKRLGQGCPDGMKIELLALYLPAGRLEGIGAATVEFRSGNLS
ncbi:MAG: hypothetical protein F4246_10985 [Rhodothermaceae bacterium]|nr:hypothetical protein [Rhodothermaceae bacterium]MXX58825.1 hypothetical protein [Rhodothermaceae bacterium]MYD20014.1 hypothetical protein [Rhodothermaceae bacterium]MYD57523.1 hypothetical protein [Rhodothermaceae bacterium]MYI43416.1 hypothetical protein [Rhodothermaceae bacterium]